MARVSLSRIRKKTADTVHAVTHRHYPKVLANSMPKSGTNLLIRLLRLLGFREEDTFVNIGPYEGVEEISVEDVKRVHRKLDRLRPGFFSGAHMYFYPRISELVQALGIKTITIVRDPRDVCTSDVFYIVKRPEHRLHRYYKKMSQEERLMASILGMSSEQLDGAPPSLDIGSHYRNYLGWMIRGAGLVIRFEDLIGPKGGGDDQRQRETADRIVRFLGINVEEEEMADLCSQLFWHGAKTFRKGQIGGWRNHFNSRNEEAFSRVIGDVMHKFGYH